jgi:hypothetical protein
MHGAGTSYKHSQRGEENSDGNWLAGGLKNIGGRKILVVLVYGICSSSIK